MGADVTLQSGSRALASDVIAASRKLVKFGRRESNSTTTTTEQGVMTLDDIPITAGRRYLIETSALLLDGSIANDVIRAVIRYTTDGSTPTTSSTILCLDQDIQPNVSFPIGASPSSTYAPVSDETLSLLLSVARVTGTGTVGMLGGSTTPIEVLVWDLGTDIGDSGTDI